MGETEVGNCALSGGGGGGGGDLLWRVLTFSNFFLHLGPSQENPSRNVDTDKDVHMFGS